MERIMSQPSSSTEFQIAKTPIEYEEILDKPLSEYSIHRLSQLSNKQGGSNLKRQFEARVGGTIRSNLGTNNGSDNVLENHANFIVSKMEQDEALMQNSPDADELRRTALRDMPQCLTVKRSVKDKLSLSVQQKSKRRSLGCWKLLKYRISIQFTKFKISIKDLAYSLELWYVPLKKIEGNFGTGVASFFKFFRWLFLLNVLTALISTCFIVIPKVIFSSNQEPSGNWSFTDLITGQGFLTNSSLYYGFFTNEIIGSILPYSMPHAYFFTMLFIYVVSFVIIGFSAARSYKRSFIETEGGLKNAFANKIFCGWDFNIATKDAAELKSKAIFSELKELIWDFAKTKRKKSCYERFLVVSVRIFANILILSLTACTGAALWYFLENVSVDGDMRVLLAPIFINSIMTLMPMLLSFVVKYEDYKDPKTALYMTLSRTFLLGTINIAVLVTYWLKNDNKSACWETLLGQEFYRMIIFDFIIAILCTALLQIILFFIFKYCTKTAFLEFDIAWNTMQIIYNQTLFWVGLVFSPLLPVVIVIKLFITWYIRYSVVLFLCKPSTKSWRAAQTSTWFLFMIFISLLCIGVLIGYIISYIQTSESCGPFNDYEHIYEIITIGVLQLRTNSTVWAVVLFVTKPGVIALIAIFLCAAIYYARAKANSQKEIVKQCRNMLTWSAKDKEYLNSLAFQVTKGQWQYQLQDKTFNPHLFDPSLTNHFDYRTGDLDRVDYENGSGMRFRASTSDFQDLNKDNSGY
ncbi:hypothetical protein ABEB36_008365 [Hypothenemus hampei]